MELEEMLRALAEADGSKILIQDKRTRAPYHKKDDELKPARDPEGLYGKDKARIPLTYKGEVPLNQGKYGMSVEEYLQWVAFREKRASFRGTLREAFKELDLSSDLDKSKAQPKHRPPTLLEEEKDDSQDY